MQLFHRVRRKLAAYAVERKLAVVILRQERIVAALTPRALQHVHVGLADLVQRYARYHGRVVHVGYQLLYLALQLCGRLGVALLYRLVKLRAQPVGLLVGVQGFVGLARVHARLHQVEVLLRVGVAERLPALVVVHPRVLGRAVAKYHCLYARPSVARVHRIHQLPIAVKCAVLQQLPRALVGLFKLTAARYVAHAAPKYRIPCLGRLFAPGHGRLQCVK